MQSRLSRLRSRLGDTVFFNRVIFISGRGYTRAGTLVSVDGATCVVEWNACDQNPVLLRERISIFLITFDEPEVTETAAVW